VSVSDKIVPVSDKIVCLFSTLLYKNPLKGFSVDTKTSRFNPLRPNGNYMNHLL
jgi:hypothetical protein